MATEVAVIGAGPAGLCALKHMLHSTDSGRFAPVAFERNAHVGGVWLHTSDTSKVPLHSAVYDSMTTNIPKEIMIYEDFPFPPNGDLPSYIHHSEFLKYLEAFKDHFELEQYIQFNTEVKKVTPVPNTASHHFLNDTIWEVTTENLLTGEEKTHYFDAVLICNGQFSKPNSGSVTGLCNFKGTVVHSQKYREPSPFQSQSVLIVGSGWSGIDIGLEIASTARVVYVSKRKRKAATDVGGLSDDQVIAIYKSSINRLPVNFQYVSGTSHVSEDGSVVLDDGSVLHVDTIMLCTGYHYSFPFLSEDCGITVRNHRVQPLYKHVFNIHHPSMAFIGLNYGIVPFANFDAKLKFILSVFTKNSILPDKHGMLADEEEDFQERLECGMLPKDAHWLGNGRQWKYNMELAKIGCFEPCPKFLEKVYNRSIQNRIECVCTYKSLKCILLDPEKGTFQFR